MVQAKLAALGQKRSAGLQDLPLFDFMVAASPVVHGRQTVKPVHFAALLPFFERIEAGEPTFLCYSGPPRHGKSLVTNHLVALLMLRKPGFRVAYGSYSLDLSAGWFSDEVKGIFEENDIPIDRRHNTKEEWRLENGSTFKAVAPNSGFVGRGADLIVIDDPYKGRAEASSGKIREERWAWVRETAITRRSPRASVIVTHTRWHYEDVIGMLDREIGVPYLNFEAINSDGEALWPEEWPAERLLTEVRPIIGEYGWAAQYMGRPIPMGGALFRDGYGLYTDLPKQFKKIVIGIDCAYTKKTYSDYSVAVVLGTDDKDRCYILDVIRKQCDAPEFLTTLRQLRATYDSPPIYWYVGGIEKGVADFFTNSGVPVKAVTAKEDKFARAQAVAAAWNAEKVFMPVAPKPWVDTFISEVLSFSGLDDPHDDQVDALAAAFIPSVSKKVRRGMIGSPLSPY